MEVKQATIIRLLRHWETKKLGELLIIEISLVKKSSSNNWD